MDDERFQQLNDEITALGISHMGDLQEFRRQSLAIFQRYGTTEAEYDTHLERRLRDLRRWRDSGFKDDSKSKGKLKVVGIVAALVVAIIAIIILIGQR